MILEEDLPDEKDLPFIFVDSAMKLIEGGYEWVGIDHFAKKDDELAIAKKIKKLKSALLKIASRNILVIFPGLTHLQTAQPISVGHFFMA